MPGRADICPAVDLPTTGPERAIDVQFPGLGLSPPCRGSTRPESFGNAPDLWSTPRPAPARVKRQASPNGDLDTLRSCRGQSAAFASDQVEHGWCDRQDIGSGARRNQSVRMQPSTLPFSIGSCRTAVCDDLWPGHPTRYRWIHRLARPLGQPLARDSEHRLSTQVRGVKR